MRRHHAIALVCAFATAPVVAQAFRPAADPGAAPTEHAQCAHLTMLRLPDVKVTEAVDVPAATAGAVRAAHCRVSGVIGREIRFTLLLPDEWNHKFFMGGGGGFVGTVENSAQSTVNLGYATAGTDTGHQGGATEAGWALDHPERLVNFGSLAVHRTAEVARAIVLSYYGSGSTRSYFMGCSRGGGQAVMEAIRYPDDFDGVVAGAPALDWTGIGAEFVKDSQAAFPDPHRLTSPVLPRETMAFVGSRILAACDALDGVTDGVMEDPRRCTFDVNTLPACAGSRPAADCVTGAQRAALKKIYAPATGPDGELYPGQPFGGEAEPGGWPAWITGVDPQLAAQHAPTLRFAFGTELFKYIVFDDPAWDYSRYDFSHFKRDTRFAASVLNATSPDLDAFKAKGHKLILWHGWADAGLSPLGTVRYYEQVAARDAGVNGYVRLFMLPGVLHCGGGAGPDRVDWASAIADWVERGQVPDRLVASKRAPGGAVVRTRPVCPYPQHAVYSGTGSTDRAESFACR